MLYSKCMDLSEYLVFQDLSFYTSERENREESLISYFLETSSYSEAFIYLTSLSFQCFTVYIVNAQGWNMV